MIIEVTCSTTLLTTEKDTFSEATRYPFIHEERAIKGKLSARNFKAGAAAGFLIKMRDNFSDKKKSAVAAEELIIRPKRAQSRTERFICAEFLPAAASETILVTARLSPDKERVIAKENTLQVRE